MRWPWNRLESEMEREIAHHLHELASEYERQGHPPEEARRLARREFGGREQVKEQCRDESRWAWLTGARQDVTFGLRLMRRTPVVTAAAVLSLALGIGATTAIVSLIDVVLWRKLPLPEAKHLTVVNWQSRKFPEGLMKNSAGSYGEEGGWGVGDFFSYAAFQAMRTGVAGRAEVAAFTFPDRVSISFAGQPAVAQQRPVSGNFLSTLRVRPAMGRLLLDSDDSDAAPATVALSYGFWERALGSNPSVVGETMRINDKPHLIVGVLEPGFYGLNPGDSTEVYTPLHHGAWLQDARRGSMLADERSWCVSMLARRAPGVGEAQILPALDTMFRASWTAKPMDAPKTPQVRLVDGSRGLGAMRDEFRSPLLVLGGLVGLLLVIACTNIANLLLARASARRKEVAMRVSLGCSQARLMRQFLTESGLLALLGGAASVAIAYATANLLGTYLGTRDNIPVTVVLSGRLLGAIGAITLAALALFGLFPAWRGSRFDTASALKGGAGSMGGASRRWWTTERLLVLGQTAMSIVLVMAAVIFTRNLAGIRSADPGFDRRNMILFNVRPGVSGYEASRLAPFYFNLEQRLLETPGVAGVGLASMRPMNIGGWWQRVRLADRGESVGTGVNSVTPGYLPLYSRQMVAGRGITVADIRSKANVAVISEDLARKLGGLAMLGRKIQFTDDDPAAAPPTFEVVGIAPAMAATSMKERPHMVWLPLELDRVEATVVLRTTGPPGAVLPAIRRTIAGIDRNLPMVDPTTMEEQISKGLSRERMFATLCGGLGLLAMVLSVVGIYGTMSYNTSRRRGEIGMRLALGAMPRDVLAMVLKEGLAMAALGMIAGAPVIWFGAKFLEKELFQMKPLEPLSVAIAFGVLLAAALVAVTIPAIQASGVRPVEALRQE